MQSDSQSTQRTLRSYTPQILSPKKQYAAILSQKRSSQRRNVFNIYSDTPDSYLQEHSPPKPRPQKLIFQGVVIPRTFFSQNFDSQTTLVPTASQTPLQPISGNIQHSSKILSMLRKPEMKVSFNKGRKWELNQPNDHTSTSLSLSFSLSFYHKHIMLRKSPRD
jgi:hypothetical protein